MHETTYSQPIARAIEKFLREEKLKFSFDSEAGLFTAETWPTKKFGSFSASFLVGEDDFTVIGLLPMMILVADAQKIAALAEFVCRINRTLRRSTFDFDINAGELLCKSHVPCYDGIPSYRTIGKSFYHLMDLYGLYGDGFIQVFSGIRTAEAAAEEIESSGTNPNAMLIFEEMFEKFVELSDQKGERGDKLPLPRRAGNDRGV